MTCLRWIGSSYIRAATLAYGGAFRTPDAGDPVQPRDFELGVRRRDEALRRAEERILLMPWSF
jgi:hypothetical protein